MDNENNRHNDRNSPKYNNEQFNEINHRAHKTGTSVLRLILNVS